jgi:hypothetical protein
VVTEDIIRMAIEAGFDEWESYCCSGHERHPMFGEGYDYALGQIKECIKARGQE